MTINKKKHLQSLKTIEKQFFFSYLTLIKMWVRLWIENSSTITPNVSAIKEIELCSSNNKLITSSHSHRSFFVQSRTKNRNACVHVMKRTCCCCCCFIQIHIFEKYKERTTQIDAIHYSFRIVSLENKSMIIISFVNILDSMEGNSLNVDSKI